jgi:hypothetical protein
VWWELKAVLPQVLHCLLLRGPVPSLHQEVHLAVVLLPLGLLLLGLHCFLLRGSVPSLHQ